MNEEKAYCHHSKSKKIKTLGDYTKIVIETDEDNPVTIAAVEAGSIFMADGYRVRLTPKYD